MPIAASSWSVGDTLGVVGVVLTVLVGVVVYRRQRRTKYLEWIVFSDGPLVSPDMRQSGLELVQDGRRLHDPQYVNLTIYNLSREAIRRDDFETPITITVPSGVIVSVTTSTNSTDFAAEAELNDDHTLIVQPLLMNFSDKITVAFVVDGSTAGLDMRSRIAGQTERPRRGRLRSPTDDTWPWRPSRAAMAAIVVVLAGGIVALARGIYSFVQ